jgi:predicted TIM-barrel fold metal-dependent hydrolase
MPTEPIIDAHHHLWRLAHTPWLNGPLEPRIFGDYSALRRDYLAPEFVPTVQACGVEKSVYVQVNVAPGAEIDEVRWVQSVADRHGFPHGIIGYADLASPSLARTLAKHSDCANFRGVRQQLHWHPNSLYRFAARPDIMYDKAWRRGLSQVGERKLVFELQVFSAQMADAARLAADFPQVTFVLLHAGMPEDASEQGRDSWRAGMRGLAERANVQVKLSGLGTFCRRCSLPLWQPVVAETVAMFGAERCMFGSNFPIESLWTTYGEIVKVMRDCIAQYPTTQRHAILFENAKRVYRL